MNTDQLIAKLANDVAPISRHAVARRVAVGIALGAVGTLLLIGLGLGFNPQLDTAMRGYFFWLKWGYTFSLGLCAVIATTRLARPDSGNLSWLWVMTLPVGSLAVVGVLEMSRVPSGQWMPMWLGETWRECPVLVFLLSLPIFAGLLWSFRRMAPTRLRAAGATAGLTAGAWAGTLYCLHCPEVSAIFVLTWYSLGIGLAALVGALLGPRLMRW